MGRLLLHANDFYTFSARWPFIITERKKGCVAVAPAAASNKKDCRQSEKRRQTPTHTHTQRQTSKHTNNKATFASAAPFHRVSVCGCTELV